jgi:hypothetical protein
VVEFVVEVESVEELELPLFEQPNSAMAIAEVNKNLFINVYLVQE